MIYAVAGPHVSRPKQRPLKEFQLRSTLQTLPQHRPQPVLELHPVPLPSSRIRQFHPRTVPFSTQLRPAHVLRDRSHHRHNHLGPQPLDRLCQPTFAIAANLYSLLPLQPVNGPSAQIHQVTSQPGKCGKKLLMLQRRKSSYKRPPHRAIKPRIRSIKKSPRSWGRFSYKKHSHARWPILPSQPLARRGLIRPRQLNTPRKARFPPAYSARQSRCRHFFRRKTAAPSQSPAKNWVRPACQTQTRQDYC